MNLIYPLGLIGLLAIPVLVLIYIIKNRYTEQTISSTYIWNLSEKFLKRRVPISKIAGIISLILQILAVVFISLAMAHPVITVANSAGSYCFVLDGSGSMNFVQNGSTRFEIAKGRITDIVDGSANGSEYTLIYAGATTETVFENMTDKKAVKQTLSELEVNYSGGDMTGALEIAQEYFNGNPAVQVYLVTDKAYISYYNISLINVAKSVENYAVTDVTYGLSGGEFKVSGTLTSYASDATVTVQLYFDKETVPYTQKVELTMLEETPFEFSCDRTAFELFRVVIDEEDALPLDNELIVYNQNVKNVSEVLIVSVSKNPFFLRAALYSAGVTDPDCVTPDKYADRRGYSLYIFDNFVPETLPDDGAVWFINPQATLAGTNFSYQSQVVASEPASYANPGSSTLEKLLKGVSRREFELTQYAKCAFTGGFSRIVSCEGNPLLFVGTNAYGNREAVFAFDLHDSAPFALSADFSLLVKNLISYSFPSVIDETVFVCGDIMPVNMFAGCKNVKIIAPSGKTFFPDPGVAVVDFELTEVGVYTVVAVMHDGTERAVNAYAALSEEEREPLALGDDFTIMGSAEYGRFDGYFDPLLILAIILAALIIADFGVYCYEQYQLR